MKSKAAARIVTILILMGALGVVIARKTDFRFARMTERQEVKPQDTIYGMLDAARDGDVSKYLQSYTGEMAKSLERAAAESPDFAKYLRDSSFALKGIAVMEPLPQPSGEIQVRVEYVYQDRNETQYFYLTKTWGGWKISRMESAERVKTLIPYGTPVQ